MSDIASRIQEIKSALPQGVELTAVSKFHPSEAVMEAYAAGQRVFGESRAQELQEKAAALPTDIEWHFIGHLQTNKVKQVVAVADMIQSIDSLRLLRAVSDAAVKAGRRVDVLLQVHVAREETKTGFLPDEMEQAAREALTMPGVRLRGVMGMASNTDDETRVRADFKAIRGSFDALRHGAAAGQPQFDTVSMGMSHDRAVAIEEGSTMVRIGSDIFGER
ncbi:YggS family pyridoxal phosphate-dependent enzyme [Paramuribaculum intestinale]|uniref:YggS family pyridoxal phosphate-dependent enzyme n=1 Tax=Paramuribaculum intestinale TaxID=2094151 RepID=UPI00272AF567|nr:YggS family pyridoxal phosphate-dependent enzyme [Paramuribaculum intestinale]